MSCGWSTVAACVDVRSSKIRKRQFKTIRLVSVTKEVLGGLGNVLPFSQSPYSRAIPNLLKRSRISATFTEANLNFLAKFLSKPAFSALDGIGPHDLRNQKSRDYSDGGQSSKTELFH